MDVTKPLNWGFFMSAKYGFVYLWRDRKYNRYYVGCHWGTVDDGYICSSNWMRNSYKNRPQDFRRRILRTGITDRAQMYLEEHKVFQRIKPEEIKIRYYNLCLNTVKAPWHTDPYKNMTIGQKISAAKKGKPLGPCSPEKAKAISDAKLAKNHKMTEEAKQLNREWHLGRPLKEDHKKNISAGLLKGEPKKIRPRLPKDELKECRMVSQRLAAAALKGAFRYNNGVKEISAKEHPGEGWVKGGLPRKKRPRK